MSASDSIKPAMRCVWVEAWDFGARIEGRFDRFTFAISDFWGWDDGFYLDLVQQYERTSDATTGAPLSVASRGNTTGCTVRTNAAGAPVGPNGIAGDSDDVFPSAGNCLLWDPPETPDAQQLLRRVIEAGANVQRFERVQPSLHQIFLQRVGATGVEEGMSGHG